ncbi:MAG: DUF262 domain-containing protein [Lachnospiraceae bacterium]|nr:DUF262 domain-containing protein [Lachnospiraceae bacterium]MCM1236663.1 DUF262 domain-containing protein [Ruminococcus flavefaciens]
MDNYMQFELEDYIEESNEFDLFNSAVVWGMDWTTETIASQLEKGNIDINPKFQRRDAWTQEEKSRLIESLMLGLPVPTIILAEMKDKKNSFVVIDGKQRLLSIKQFCSKKEEFTKLRLRKMEVLSELDGKTMQDLTEDSRYDRFLTSFENATIRTIVIKNWPNEQFLYSVFLRLNTGSKPLSPQELRQALHPGRFLDFLDDATADSKEMMRVLRNIKADSRMRDIELALRYYGYLYNRENYNGNLREFLDDTCKKMNEIWDEEQIKIKNQFKELEESIKFCFDIFGQKQAFSKWENGEYNNRFNRALFEVFTFYFSDANVRHSLNKEKFKQGFCKICETDSFFMDSISNTTKEVKRVKKRFSTIETLIYEIIPNLTRRY